MVDDFSTALKFHAETESLMNNVVSDIICKEGGVSNDLGSLIKEHPFLDFQCEEHWHLLQECSNVTCQMMISIWGSSFHLKFLYCF